MKITLRLLLLAIISAVLACEAAYSATTDEAKGRQDVRTAAQQSDHDRAAKKIRRTALQVRQSEIIPSRFRATKNVCRPESSRTRRDRVPAVRPVLRIAGSP